MRRTRASSLPSELTTDATKVDRKCVKMVVSSLAAMFDEVFFTTRRGNDSFYAQIVPQHPVLFNKLAARKQNPKSKLLAYLTRVLMGVC